MGVEKPEGVTCPETKTVSCTKYSTDSKIVLGSTSINNSYYLISLSSDGSTNYNNSIINGDNITAGNSSNAAYT